MRCHFQGQGFCNKMYISELFTVGYLHAAGFKNRRGINFANCIFSFLYLFLSSFLFPPRPFLVSLLPVLNWWCLKTHKISGIVQLNMNKGVDHEEFLLSEGCALEEWTYECVKEHLKPTHLKSSPLFTFSTKSLGQDSPSIRLFSKIIGSRFTTAKMKLVEDLPSWFVFSWSRFTFK